MFQKQYDAQLKAWKHRVPNAYEMEEPQPDAPVNLGMGLIGLSASGHKPDALREAGLLPAGSPAGKRGVAFLLRTQFADGSWFVRSRTWPFQPYFNSQFPHGKDQWISAAGSTWATLALLNALDPSSRTNSSILSASRD